jgi:lysozyme family protein
MDFVDRVIAREGGAKVTNYSADPGGVTKYGISQRAHPGLDIAKLTYAQARDIYLDEYFHAPGLGQLSSGKLQEFLFDYGVHSGAQTAIRTLQKLVGVVETGVIDNLTAAAVNTGDANTLLARLIEQRILFLARQVVAKPAKLLFLIGWLSRVLSFL